jgi:hypothetical protein
MLQEFLALFGRDMAFILVLVIFNALVGLAFFIVIQWRKIRQAEIQAALKHDMLERGMSAEQIKLVLEAGQDLVALAALGKRSEPTGAVPVARQAQSGA